VTSEWGTFHIAANGTPVFRDRHARPKRLAADAVIDGGLAGLRVEREAARAAGRVEATIAPREVGGAPVVLWQRPASLRLRKGETRVITCAFRDPEGARLAGALRVERVQPGLDFHATTRVDAADPLGIDLTDRVRIDAALGAAGAVLSVRADWPDDVYVHGLQVRGVPLRAFDRATVSAEDPASSALYGRRVLRIALPLAADEAAAGDLAGALLASHAVPRPWPVITIEAAPGGDLAGHALRRDVGDRVHVSDAGAGLDAAACFIEGVRHSITRGGARHRVTWLTSPADLSAAWVLDHAAAGALGAGSRLGY
jgi:hypothetical protein